VPYLESSLFDKINLSSFVVIDVETTGFDHHKERVIELAAIKYEGGKEVDAFTSFVNPEKEIPAHITKLTGIRDADVEDAPLFAELADALRDFLGDLPIIGHNVQFDTKFLESEIRLAEGDFSRWSRGNEHFQYLGRQQYDTVLLARTIFPQLNSYKLEQLAQHFELTHKDAHRASDDARATGALFLRVTEEFCYREIEPLKLIVDILKATESMNFDYFQAILDAKKDALFDESRLLINSMESHDNILGKAPREKSDPSEMNPVDEAVIDAFFGEGSKMAGRLDAYEMRSEQVELSKQITRAFNQEEFLIAEAGTGTGKSLAYLVPSILWGQKNRNANGRVVISTNTKNLQEQLFYKDLPFIQGLMDSDFQAVLLKGKTNYLCKDKWTRHLFLERKNLTEYEREQLLPLIYWGFSTQSGDIAENNAFNSERNVGLWLKFVAENNYCFGRKCPHYNNCHLIKVRNTAKQADLVVVNHSLLFTDMQGDNALLGEYKHVVIDEAHNIERVATDYLGDEFNFWSVQRFARQLYSKTKKEEKGVLQQLWQRIESKSSSLNEGVYERSITLIKAAKRESSAFNEIYAELFTELGKFVEGKQENGAEKIRYTDGHRFFDSLDSVFGKFNRSCEKVIDALFNLNEQLNELDEDTISMQTQIQQDLKSRYSDIVAFASSFITLSAAGNDEYVFWVEPAIRKNDFPRLVMAPLHVDKLLHQLFYDKLNSAIFSSATLAVDNNFDYFSRRVGLKHLDADRVQALNVGSPFKHSEQSRLLLPRFLPDPNHPNYGIELARLVNKLVASKKNGILVLFTSYSLMRSVASLVEIDDAARPMLVQGTHGSRSSIVSRAKLAGNALVFGTDSFWEGVDLPGSAIETVLLTKLPFAVPSDPIIAAKMDLIRKGNENPFMAFSVPEAIIKMRQGVGRLIRTKNDVGDIIIADNRLITKMYGRNFLNSLPLEATRLNTEADFDEAMKRS
jgi:predicted DnaQ family exonuclease/DinG family helicase